MDTDTKLRQMHKDEFYVGWHALLKAKDNYMGMVRNGVLSIDPVEVDLVAACMHRIEFAFQTLLEVVVHAMDEYMAKSTFDAMTTHPDGFMFALQRIADGEMEKI